MSSHSRQTLDRQIRSFNRTRNASVLGGKVGLSVLQQAARAAFAGLILVGFVSGQTGCLRRPKPAWPTAPVIAQADDDVFFRFRPKPQPKQQIADSTVAKVALTAPNAAPIRPSVATPKRVPGNWFNTRLVAAPELPAAAPEPIDSPVPIELLPPLSRPQPQVEPTEGPMVEREPDVADLLPEPASDLELSPIEDKPDIDLLPRLMPVERDARDTPASPDNSKLEPSTLKDDMEQLRRMAENQLDAKFGTTEPETPAAQPPTPPPAQRTLELPSVESDTWQGLALPGDAVHPEDPVTMASPTVSPSPLNLPDSLASPTASDVTTSKILNASDQTDNFRDLTEDEMLSIALSNAPTLRSLGIRILSSPESTSTIYDTAIRATDPFFGPAAALADFDSQLSASLNANKNDRVFNNTTLGGDVQELTQDTIDTQLGWQKRAWNGAVFDVQSIQRYDDNNRQGNRFPNYWESLLEAGVRQPLLRGAGRQFNAIAGPNAQPGFNFSNGIVIARLNTKISDADFQIALRDYVQNLYTAYWSLRREYESLQSLVEARGLAFETWQAVLAKKKANIRGGEAHVEAQARARYYRLRREVASALDGQDGTSGYYVSERALRQLIGLPVADGSVLRPIDPPADVRYVYDFDRLASQAMQGRIELQRQSLKLQQQQYRLVAAKNFLLPQLDLVGRYRLRGFGDDLTGGGARFASASDDFSSMDHQEWQFGVEMGVPAGRRQAKSAVNNAKLELTRERAIFEEQQRAIRYEVGNAFAEVASAFESLSASKELLNAAQDRLNASTALYEADKIQLEFLLDAQEELVQARRRIAEDQSRYSLALISVNASTGTLLKDLGIRTATQCCGVQAVSY